MRPLIAGNWKMNGLVAQLNEIEEIARSVVASPVGADIMLCLPATLIAQAARMAAGRIAIGGETCHEKIAGAFTGDISAEMLKDAGPGAVIVGHSERRRHHGETDAVVQGKAKAARRAGLLAIICFGETESQRRDGQALETCGKQIAGSMPPGITSAEIAIGYEPLWAIGTGKVPSLKEIAEMHEYIRKGLIQQMGIDGKSVRILYGGSVKPANAREILALPEVGGALVGGASLKAKDFEAILRATPVN